tara:strand:+ start:133 stop:417 length:285 start_codon:yes stop_codon:yes gene_type:complete
MSLPQSIPSKISGTAGVITTPDAVPPSTAHDKNAGKPQTFIYITAIISEVNAAGANLTIDGVTLSTPSSVSLSSPIKCRSVTTTADGQIAYYIK